MPVKQIRSTIFYEFKVTVAQDGAKFFGQGWRLSDNSQAAPIVEESSADDAELAVKLLLAKLTEGYVGIDGAIAKFKQVYPNGFSDAYYVAKERKYKADLASKFEAVAGIAAFAGAATNDAAAAQLGANLLKLFSNDLLIAVEKAKLKGVIQKDPVGFVRALGNVLHSGEPWPAFSAFSALLARGGASGWAIATYFPFCLDPSSWLLVRPRTLQEASRALGIQLGYSSDVSTKNYQSILAFADEVFRKLAVLTPVDRIDIYSFFYITNAVGYVAEMASARPDWERKQIALRV